jgi:hypothetical protein
MCSLIASLHQWFICIHLSYSYLNAQGILFLYRSTPVRYQTSTERRFATSACTAIAEDLLPSFVQHSTIFKTVVDSRHTSRVSKGISAQASHRTVLAPLNAHGSSCSKNSKHYSLILLNSILFYFRKIVFVSSNKQAKPFAPSPLQKLHHYYDLVRNYFTLLPSSMELNCLYKQGFMHIVIIVLPSSIQKPV